MPQMPSSVNSSVNSYRRLDPHYEAPNQIKASAIDRGSMVRIPLGNERSARIEVRSVAPDANPYMSVYTILRTGLEGPKETEDESKKSRTRFLPDNIYDAIRLFKGSRFLAEQLGEERGVERERRGPALRERRVALVHERADISEQQVACEGRRL